MGKIFRKLDKPLLIATLLMFAFGFLMIFSASYVKANVSMGNAFYYLYKQGIILGACLVAFLLVLNTSTSLYKKYIKFALYITIGLLIALFSYGIMVNGAQSWFDLGFFNLQPSEIAKVVLIVYFGVYYDKNKNSDKISVLLKPLLFAVVILGLIVFQPDYGTALILFSIIVLMFIALPINKAVKRKIYVITLIGILVVVSLILAIKLYKGESILSESRMQRFNIINPCKRYTEIGTGYQVCNGYIAINNGGLFGVGIGNSTQKYLYLPEAHTDFIFPIIMEEMGLVISGVVVLLYVLILCRIIYISRRSSTLMGSIICYGIAVFMFLHIFVNFTGIFGLLPLTGVPLPFLSYGGTFALIMATCMGIVQRICYESKVHEQSKSLEDNIKGK